MAGKQAFDNTNKGRFFLNERKTAKAPALSGPGNYNTGRLGYVPG